MRWMVSLLLLSLWMIGIVAGWTFGGLIHLIALYVVARELIGGRRRARPA
jgi:hypothetical protein